jgi:virginiamycin B lyase
MTRSRLCLPALVALTCPATTAAPAGAQSSPGRCDDVKASASVFARPGPPGAGWIENLGFDRRGGMWVSELLANKVVQLDTAGRQTASIPVSSPGAIAFGRDQLMYANFGDSMTAGLTGTGGGVVRFDPRDRAPAPEPFVSGLGMANGSAFDAAGNLYVSNTYGKGIVRIRANGTLDPAFAQATAGISGANGLAVEGRSLYVTVTFDPQSPVIRVPLDEPSASRTVATLGDGLQTKVLDDLAIGRDRRLYVSAGSGQLLRVDPGTGAACIVYSGPPLTSVRFPRRFSPYDAARDLFLTSEQGQIIRLRLKRTR